jgi:hypothetical protein
MRLHYAIVTTLFACSPSHKEMSMSATGADPAAYSAEVQAAYGRVRAATSAYHTLDSAVAAGYAAVVPACISDSTHGAMGYHHLNRGYVDKDVILEQPEFLLYERKPDGKYVLNGVEYVVPYRFWPKDSVPPKLLGRDMLRSDALSYWYMHMWVWTNNSAGLFADWNPAVKCG